MGFIRHLLVPAMVLLESTHQITAKGVENVCTKDLYQCTDGEMVTRNPTDRCHFFACASGEIPSDRSTSGSLQPMQPTIQTKEKTPAEKSTKVDKKENDEKAGDTKPQDKKESDKKEGEAKKEDDKTEPKKEEEKKDGDGKKEDDKTEGKKEEKQDGDDKKEDDKTEPKKKEEEKQNGDDQKEDDKTEDKKEEKKEDGKKEADKAEDKKEDDKSEPKKVEKTEEDDKKVANKTEPKQEEKKDGDDKGEDNKAEDKKEEKKKSNDTMVADKTIDHKDEEKKDGDDKKSEEEQDAKKPEVKSEASGAVAKPLNATNATSDLKANVTADGFTIISDLNDANVNNAAAVAFAQWDDQTTCEHFQFQVQSVKNKREANATIYVMGVEATCTNKKSKFSGHFHVEGHKRDTVNSTFIVTKCGEVEHHRVQNWLAIKGDKALCETPAQRANFEAEVQLESQSKGESGIVGQVKKAIETVDNTALFVIACAAVSLVVIILIVAIAIGRATGPRSSRSVLNPDSEENDFEDDVDDDLAEDEQVLFGDNKSPSTSDAETKSFATDDSKEDVEEMEEGSFVTSSKSIDI